MKPKLILTIKDKQSKATDVKSYPPRPDPVKKPRQQIWNMAQKMPPNNNA